MVEEEEEEEEEGKWGRVATAMARAPTGENRRIRCVLKKMLEKGPYVSQVLRFFLSLARNMRKIFNIQN